MYVEYEPSPPTANHAEIKRKVLINGGHGVANSKTLVTPKGIVTKVTDDEMEFLLKNEAFQRHVKNGFLSYDKNKADPEKKAANMMKGDRSAPLTPNDFKTGEHSDEDARIYTGKPMK